MNAASYGFEFRVPVNRRVRRRRMLSALPPSPSAGSSCCPCLLLRPSERAAAAGQPAAVRLTPDRALSVSARGLSRSRRRDRRAGSPMWTRHRRWPLVRAHLSGSRPALFDGSLVADLFMNFWNRSRPAAVRLAQRMRRSVHARCGAVRRHCRALGASSLADARADASRP